MPQLFGSLATDVQAPGFVPHTISLLGHAPHAPLVQGAPVAHTWPHAPQLFGSVCSSTQAPGFVPQRTSPFGQTHWPDTQEAPTAHAFPQAPQLFGSLVVSTQPAAGHEVRPVWHAQAVTGGLPVVWHVEPVPQTTPHAPQLKLSFVVFTHCC